MPERSMADEGIVNRTFVTAHLLTARIDLAESATLEAIKAWKPTIEAAEEIFTHGVKSALRKRERRNASCLRRDNGTHSYLPAELRMVLELRPALRLSFVLRLLAGFSLEDCAELLGCTPERVAHAARTAVGLLPSFHRMISRGELMGHQEVDQSRIEQVAYDFWVQRGCPMGSPEEDWFSAAAMWAVHFLTTPCS
jgi:Protein of unknown function (DUF2934)